MRVRREPVEQRVEVPTPDGVADAFLYRHEGAPAPAVVMLPDGIGMRPSQRQMASRLAGEGYAVLLPNIYYRTGKEPFFEPKPDLSDPPTRAHFQELTAPVTPDAMERDGAAYLDFVLAQDSVAPGRAGVVGYCFTGAFALRTAAARPDVVAAAASFHGGGLYKDDSSSPHLVLPRVKARLYFGHARDDRSMPAAAIEKLEEALAAWGGRYESETYDARHGWTVPDSAAWDDAQAEVAFANLRELFAAAL